MRACAYLCILISFATMLVFIHKSVYLCACIFVFCVCKCMCSAFVFMGILFILRISVWVKVDVETGGDLTCRQENQYVSLKTYLSICLLYISVNPTKYIYNLWHTQSLYKIDSHALNMSKCTSLSPVISAILSRLNNSLKSYLRLANINIIFVVGVLPFEPVRLTKSLSLTTSIQCTV